MQLVRPAVENLSRRYPPPIWHATGDSRLLTRLKVLGPG